MKIYLQIMSKKVTVEQSKRVKKTKKDDQDTKVIAKKSTLTDVKKVGKLAKSDKSTKRIIAKHKSNSLEEKVRHIHKKVSIEIDETGKFDLDDQASIEYYGNFITKKFHDELFKELCDDVPWTHGIYNMYGKAVKTPRLLYCMRDKDFDVSQVYKVTESMEWTKNMLKLKKMVEKKTNRKYSYAQLNYYRTGDDYIGYHTDSEVQDGDVIASVSLGVTRKFTFRQINYKDNDSDIYTMDLEGRSLILMNEYAAKKSWKHELPKMKNVQDVRINITFRPK